MATFIEYCDEAIKVLKQAKIDNNKLAMWDWITNIKTELQHDCGTAACVCGYMAIGRGYTGKAESETPLNNPETIYKDWAKSEKEVLDDIYLTDAMTDSSADTRLWQADASEVFTEEELTHPFLNSDNEDENGFEDFEHAISFIQLCKSKFIEAQTNAK